MDEFVQRLAPHNPQESDRARIGLAGVLNDFDIKDSVAIEQQKMREQSLEQTRRELFATATNIVVLRDMISSCMTKTGNIPTVEDELFRKTLLMIDFVVDEIKKRRAKGETADFICESLLQKKPLTMFGELPMKYGIRTVFEKILENAIAKVREDELKKVRGLAF